ncbi:MAG: phage tail protein [Leptolyngbyaceae cyanobacterium bins.302]|nr:phage tail protein [Leptolyngbyaceae cyanobacterium bins.302]
MTTTIRSPSRLLDYLPVIYQDDPFVGQFLLAFEKLLLGFKDDISIPTLENVHFSDAGLEDTIANVASYFDPLQTPDDFLPWLASWTALTLRADIERTVQRQFIANMVSFYRLRGTKKNLQKLLSLFVQGTPTIEETSDQSLQIGKHSTIGKDTYLGGGAAHYFTVTIVLPDSLQNNPAELARQREIASALIELEKPAHTECRLITISYGTIQVGVISTVGVNTVLGNIPPAKN